MEYNVRPDPDGNDVLSGRDPAAPAGDPEGHDKLPCGASAVAEVDEDHRATTLVPSR